MRPPGKKFGPAFPPGRNEIGVEGGGSGGVRTRRGPRLDEPRTPCGQISTFRPSRRRRASRGAFSFSLISETSASVVSIRPAIDAAFCSAVLRDLGRVDDAGLEHVLDLLGLRR